MYELFWSGSSWQLREVVGSSHPLAEFAGRFNAFEALEAARALLPKASITFPRADSQLARVTYLKRLRLPLDEAV